MVEVGRSAMSMRLASRRFSPDSNNAITSSTASSFTNGTERNALCRSLMRASRSPSMSMVERDEFDEKGEGEREKRGRERG